MEPRKPLWRDLFLLFGGLAMLLGPAGCSTTKTETRHVNLTLTKQAPAVAPASSPAALYYFSLYNWLRLQGGRKAQATALESLRRAVKADPDSLYLRLELAEQLLKNMKVEEARVNAQAALDLDPGIEWAREHLQELGA